MHVVNEPIKAVCSSAHAYKTEATSSANKYTSRMTVMACKRKKRMKKIEEEEALALLAAFANVLGA